MWFLLELADAAWALITTVMGDLYRLDGRWEVEIVVCEVINGLQEDQELGVPRTF